MFQFGLHPMRLVRRLSFLIFASICAAFCSPTDPCEGGHDSLGRGPIEILQVFCDPMGADVQCRATSRQAGYCATGGTDITATSQWTSSNPVVATFTAPGFLKVLAPGEITISPGMGYSGDYDYTVAPGIPPERMSKLSVIVEDAAQSGKRLVGAHIEVTPERGPSQTCFSNNTGFCGFWIFPTTVRARATFSGYESTDGVAQPPTTEQTTGLSQSIFLKLSRVP